MPIQVKASSPNDDWCTETVRERVQRFQSAPSGKEVEKPDRSLKQHEQAFMSVASIAASIPETLPAAGASHRSGEGAVSKPKLAPPTIMVAATQHDFLMQLKSRIYKSSIWMHKDTRSTIMGHHDAVFGMAYGAEGGQAAGGDRRYRIGAA